MRAKRPAARRRRTGRARDGLDMEALPPGDIDALRAELERSLPPAGAARWNADPADVQRSVARLVLTLMEFLRKLLERFGLTPDELNLELGPLGRPI